MNPIVGGFRADVSPGLLRKCLLLNVAQTALRGTGALIPTVRMVMDGCLKNRQTSDLFSRHLGFCRDGPTSDLDVFGPRMDGWNQRGPEINVPSGRKQIFADVSEVRSRTMSAIKAKDTGPELIVRRLLHKLGYRYRLHLKGLPGKPDLVFSKRRKVIEIRGCFWHGHGCRMGKPPQSRLEYWIPKIAATKERDAHNMAALKADGWCVLELWECRIHIGREQLETDLVAFLGPIKA